MTQFTIHDQLQSMSLHFKAAGQAIAIGFINIVYLKTCWLQPLAQFKERGVHLSQCRVSFHNSDSTGCAPIQEY